MSTAIVAGGGVAGLLAAKLLARRHARVLLVEREAVCGGLLGSFRNAAGVWFDHGAHVLSETGHEELDQLLYGTLPESAWREFRVLRAGNWFGGAMNRDSPFPDARRLGRSLFEQGMRELEDAGAPVALDAPDSLAVVLSRRFGPTFAQHVAEVAIRKQLGVDSSALHAETPFAIRRIVCADGATSRRLKRDPRFAEPVGFSSYEEGVGLLSHRYPRSGGIGQWVELFVDGLRRDRVEILCGRTIAAIEHAEGRVSSVQLDDGRDIVCQQVAWTLPASMLLRAAGIKFAGGPPLARPIGLFHLVFDRAFEDGNYHITCYDEDMRVFRVTLYPSLRGEPGKAPFNCTVEVVGDGSTDFESLLPLVKGELRRMGITAEGARLLSSEIRVVPVGFPATTHEFMSTAARAADTARQLANVLLLGRAKCPPFFTSDVLIDVHRAIDGGGHVG